MAITGILAASSILEDQLLKVLDWKCTLTPVSGLVGGIATLKCFKNF
jgi:hypothetical protein